MFNRPNGLLGKIYLYSTRVFYKIQHLKLNGLTVYTYLICLVNSRCLHDTTLKVEPIDQDLPTSNSQLTLFAQDNC